MCKEDVQGWINLYLGPGANWEPDRNNSGDISSITSPSVSAKRWIFHPVVHALVRSVCRLLSINQSFDQS